MSPVISFAMTYFLHNEKVKKRIQTSCGLKLEWCLLDEYTWLPFHAEINKAALGRGTQRAADSYSTTPKATSSFSFPPCGLLCFRMKLKCKGHEANCSVIHDIPFPWGWAISFFFTRKCRRIEGCQSSYLRIFHLHVKIFKKIKYVLCGRYFNRNLALGGTPFNIFWWWEIRNTPT